MCHYVSCALSACLYYLLNSMLTYNNLHICAAGCVLDSWVFKNFPNIFTSNYFCSAESSGFCLDKLSLENVPLREKKKLNLDIEQLYVI